MILRETNGETQGDYRGLIETHESMVGYWRIIPLRETIGDS